jgi:hypothetical protein
VPGSAQSLGQVNKHYGDITGQCLPVFLSWFLWFPASLRNLGEAIYKSIELSALFAVLGLARARISARAAKLHPLNKSPTERKYTFSPGQHQRHG